VGDAGTAWACGPSRNDAAKTHPDLVPYGDLPQGEKECDRVTSAEVLKAIMVLGHRIEKT
jgi:hypothetical protein